MIDTRRQGLSIAGINYVSGCTCCDEIGGTARQRDDTWRSRRERFLNSLAECFVGTWVNKEIEAGIGSAKILT